MKTFPWLCFRRLNSVKMSVLPSWIYSFNTIPIKIPRTILQISTLNLNFMWKGKRPRIVNTVLKNNKVGRRTHYLDSTLTIKITLIHTIQYLQKTATHISGTEWSPEIYPHKQSTLFTKEKRQFKRESLSTNGEEQLNIYMQK